MYHVHLQVVAGALSYVETHMQKITVDLEAYPDVRHDDVVDAACSIYSKWIKLGMPNIQQLPRTTGWPVTWMYVDDREVDCVRLTIKEDDRTVTFACNSYCHTFKQKGYIPPKYELGVMMLDAGLVDGKVTIPGLGSMHVEETYCGSKKLRRVYHFVV